MAELEENFAQDAGISKLLYDYTFTIEREEMVPLSLSTLMAHDEVQETLLDSFSQAGIQMPNIIRADMTGINNINISIKPHRVGDNAATEKQIEIVLQRELLSIFLTFNFPYRMYTLFCLSLIHI